MRGLVAGTPGESRQQRVRARTPALWLNAGHCREEGTARVGVGVGVGYQETDLITGLVVRRRKGVGSGRTTEGSRSAPDALI